MSTVQILWQTMIGACLMLAAIQWLARSSNKAAPWVTLLALSIAGIAAGELAAMYAPTPEYFGRTVRWIHLPIYTAFVAIVGFVDWSFGTGRRWLGTLALSVRMVCLAMNFWFYPNLNHEKILGLREIHFLGSSVKVADAVFSQRTRLAEASTLLLLVFAFDASLRLWSKGDPDSKRRALLMGGGVVIFIATALLQGVLIHTGTVPMPYLISLPFCLLLAAMGYESSRDLKRSAAMAATLRENAESMQLAANTARIAFWQWNIADNSISMDPRGRQLYGVPAQAIVTLDDFLATLHPDDREPTRRELDAAVKGDGSFHANYRVVVPAEARHWIEARGKVEYDPHHKPLRMRTVSIDVTERQMMHERFRLSVDSSPNGVVLANAEGSILLTNQRADEMFGFAPGELLGQSADLLVPERHRRASGNSRPGFQKAPRALGMSGGRERFARRKDGSEFPVEISITPVESPEGILILSVIVDISARREAEAEARRHRDELAHVTRVTTLSELSGSLAHELNQPLAIILANAQAAQRMLAQSPPDLVEVKEILSDIVDEDRRAGEVIQRLRALLKRGETQMLPVSFNDIVTQVLHLTHTDLLGRGVTVSTDLADDLPLVSGDRVQLQQILLNLVLNAAEATMEKPGGSRHVVISTSEKDGIVRLAVRDSGIGLPEDIERLFEPFYTTKAQGLGMGLAICRSIVAAHGGRLRAEPHAEGGAVFHLDIPATVQEQA
ncbi:ATP-binding protein [Haloferula sp. BvORR071]|uniref:PAS domain-containing sensor histidine kinase n=1 Tax=Haloferula sp. BvORR071 TaxID=1396141 RepID=UPI0006963547|nr:ATP-binding protein [Haloferula sp. BvORR071]